MYYYRKDPESEPFWIWVPFIVAVSVIAYVVVVSWKYI